METNADLVPVTESPTPKNLNAGKGYRVPVDYDELLSRGYKQIFGRPTKFTPDLAGKFLALLEQGETIRSACKQISVGWSQVYKWARENESFKHAIAHARKTQSYLWADETIEIADDLSRDLYHNGKFLAVNNAAPHRDKLRVEARMKLAGIYNPLFAPQGLGNQINIQVNAATDSPKPETRAEWLARNSRATISQAPIQSVERETSSAQQPASGASTIPSGAGAPDKGSP